MKTRLLTILAVGLLLGAGVSRADDQPEAKVLLDNAMKAMGGEAKLAKLGTVAAKGKVTGLEGGQEITVDFDGTWQGASKYRANMEFQGAGKNFKMLLVINGDTGWIKKNDDTKDAPEAVVAALQNAFYAGRLPQLLPAIRDKAYTLTTLGEVQVGTQAAMGMSISHKDRKDVSLFFDKESGLPIKSELRITDPNGKEITIEYLYSEYKDFAGLKLCGKIAIKADDKEFTLELSQLKAVEKVDDGQFDRP